MFSVHIVCCAVYVQFILFISAAEKWRKITEADKKPLLKEAAELKKVYEVNMKKWNEVR
jgi:hypothetical protein